MNGAAFYFGEPPKTLVIYRPAETPWVDEETIQRDGLAIVCPESVTPCVHLWTRFPSIIKQKVVEHLSLASCSCGTEREPQRFEIAVILPVFNKQSKELSR